MLCDPAHIHSVCCTLVLPAALNASAEFIARRVARQGPGRAIVMAINADGYLELRETLIARIESGPADERSRQENPAGPDWLCLPGLTGVDLIAGGESLEQRRLFETDAVPARHLPALVQAMTEGDLLLVSCRDERTCLFHTISLAPVARIMIHAGAEDAGLRAQLEAQFANLEDGATGAAATPAGQQRPPDRGYDDPR